MGIQKNCMFYKITHLYTVLMMENSVRSTFPRETGREFVPDDILLLAEKGANTV